jgi:TetR/AcrR family transcriptional repressor of uid operon
VGKSLGQAPRRRGRPPAQRSEDTRERLLRAARVCFGEAGYAHTSMADIAHEAGITPRAIYHYVESKAELFTQAAEASYCRFVEEIAARVFVHDDARGRLKGFIDVFRALYREDPSLVAFVSLALFEADRNPDLPHPLAGHGERPNPNELLVAQAVERGELAGHIDPAGAVALLDVFGAGLTMIATGDRRGDYLPMLDVIEHLIDGSLLAESVTPTPEFHS